MVIVSIAGEVVSIAGEVVSDDGDGENDNDNPHPTSPRIVFIAGDVAAGKVVDKDIASDDDDGGNNKDDDDEHDQTQR